jgi:signal transduction histidine kinase
MVVHSHANAIPQPVLRPAGRAADRHDREGPALALRNWRVPWRLIALIAIPTVVAMGFAGLRVAAAAGSAATFGRSALLAELSQQITGLAQAMEDERDLTAAFIAAGRPADGLATLQKQYAVTDAWEHKVSAQMRGIGHDFPAQTRTDAAAVSARITDLPDLRSYATGSDAPALTVVTGYALATSDVLTFDNDMAQQAGSAALVGSMRALGSLSRMKDQASQQRAILQAALLKRQFEPGTLDALIAAQAQQEADLVAFETSATLGETQFLDDTVAGPLVDQAQALEQRAIVLGDNRAVLSLGPAVGRQWYADMSYTVDRMRMAERQLANGIALQAKALHQDATRSVLLIAATAGAAVILVLLATLVIARSMVDPLRRLKADALEVAEVRLPAEVRELAAAGHAGREVEVEPIGVHSTDEIGQVARAFDHVHHEAVRLAADEARLRGSISAMFVSLSRRSQSLLERLLRLIDSLELGEQDSERLADLFRMDHLATRMRRNSENLLVLAGQEPPRRWAEPVSLADVARASVSEIEQYDRVVLDMQHGICVAGNAVADVVHLLAEVIENATTFSAKDTLVTVSGHSLKSGGVLINVIDSGMGMPEEQLRQVNWRLENPPAADVEVSRHMGLYAVAHLAARHGIRVRLRRGADGGLGAHVWLPGSVIARDTRLGPLDGIRTARASAVVQAVTRAAKLPRDPAAAATPAEEPVAAEPPTEEFAAVLPTEEFAAAPPTEGFVAAPIAEEVVAAPPEEFTAGPAEASAAVPLTEALAGVRAEEEPPVRVPAEKEPPVGVPAEEEPSALRPPEEQRSAAPLAEAATAAVAPADVSPIVVPEAPRSVSEARLPIFESVEADWFRARRQAPRPVTSPAASPHHAASAWTPPSDDGRRATETVLTPLVSGVTAAGLPRRTPRANLMPGFAGSREDPPEEPANPAGAVSSRLADFQRGSRRARAAAPGARPPEGRPPDARSADTQPSDAQPSDARSADGQPSDVRPPDA